MSGVHEEWLRVLRPVMASESYQRLQEAVRSDREGGHVYPSPALMARALWRPPSEARVVVLGQDPYHGRDERSGIPQACGLAFSVSPGVRPPPSLQVILRELVRGELASGRRPAEWVQRLSRGLQDDTASGDLSPWAARGVVLLNTALTVREGEPGSHAPYWYHFIREVVSHLASQDRPIVWLLWGAHARRAYAAAMAYTSGTGLRAAQLPAGYGEWSVGRHLALTGPHPSPLAGRGFHGCGHFVRANQWLQEQGAQPVDWSL